MEHININFIVKNGNKITVEIDEKELLNHILHLIYVYEHNYGNRPDTLYCSPEGYLKIRALTHFSSLNFNKYIDLKPLIVPSLNQDFEVYNSDSEDYIHMF